MTEMEKFFEKFTDLQTLWDACYRPEWMFHIMFANGVPMLTIGHCFNDCLVRLYPADRVESFRKGINQLTEDGLREYINGIKAFYDSRIPEPEIETTSSMSDITKNACKLFDGMARAARLKNDIEDCERIRERIPTIGE